MYIPIMCKITDRRRIKLSDVLSSDYVPFMGGRPKRTKDIGPDDQIELHERLSKIDMIEELIDAVH